MAGRSFEIPLSVCAAGIVAMLPAWAAPAFPQTTVADSLGRWTDGRAKIHLPVIRVIYRLGWKPCNEFQNVGKNPHLPTLCSTLYYRCHLACKLIADRQAW